MSNREKFINLQRRFEKDARYFADKEDYVSFEKVIEDFINDAGRLNPDINTRDLLSRHLSKASKVKSYSDALQVMNSVSSDITILSMDLHGKGEPIFTASEYNKLVRDNNIEYTKNRFEVFKKSFDLLKKNNSDRFHKIDDLRSLYLGNVKNYKDKVFKFPHLVDTEQRKLFDTLKDIITKQVFDTFEKDKEILLSYVSEIAEIGKAYVDRNIDYSDRLLDGYNIQRRREAIGESVDTEKLRRDLDKSNEKNIESLIDSIKKCFENYIKGVENLMIEHSKLYNDKIERTRAERIILGGQDEVKGIIERYKKQLEDIITSGLSKDEEIFYSIMDELKNSINENDNHLNEDRESLEKINDVFDNFKGEVNELLKDFEDDMKDNFEDEFKKLMEKLDSKFHDIMSSDDYVAFDKEEKVISSMFIDFCDELNIVVAGCLNAFKSNCINASNRFKAGMRGVRSLTDREIAEQGVKRFIDSILIMVKNIERSKSFSKEYEKKYRRSFEEIINSHIWGGDIQFASGSEKLEKHLRNLLFKDDIFSMGVTSDILKNIALSVNGVDISKDKLLTRVKSEDLVRESKQRLLGKIERYGESYREVAEHSILPIFYNLRNDAKSITDLSTLRDNFIKYTEKAENGGTYSKFLESYKKDILSAVDSFCKDFIKITDTKIDSQQRNFVGKVNDILKDYSDIFPYGTEYYFDQEIKDKLSDIKDHNASIIEECHEAYSEELSDMVFPEVIHEDIKKEIENLISKLNGFINENNNDIIITEPVFESRLDRNDILNILNHSVKPINESSSSEKAEKLIKRLILDFSIEGKEEKYYPGYHFLDKMEFEFDQIGFKIKNRIEDGNADKLQRDIPGLVDISAGLMERKYIDVIYERKEEIHKEIDNAVEEYNKILGSKDNLMKGIAFRSKYEIDSLVNDSINKVKNEFKKIRTSLSTDLKQMYTEDSTLESIKKYQDSRNHHLWVDGVVERMEKFILDLLNKTLVPKIREIFNELSFEFGISPAQVHDDITNWWRKVEFGNDLIFKKYLRSGMGDQFDLFIKRKYRRLKPNEIGLSQVIEFVKGEYEAYSMEFNNMVVEILNGYDVTYSRYNKFKDISDTARKLAKDFQKEKWVYRSFFVKHNNMIEECIEDFLSAYEKGDYHNEKWSYPYDDWYKDRNFYRVVDVELSNAYYRSVKDHEVSGRGRYKGYSTVMDESDSISENRRDIFFEAEEEKKPKISKEEKEKLKAQLDNFFADKKEAKATELKKSIADRDKAIEDVILRYSTEKEKIQREYSKNIQAAKSEAEANKLRAERDEELQRLSLEKATSIEDLKERQKKEEASIREKYQTLFDKKLEEYKDSLGDAIHDFTKDIERGIEDGIRKNPIFQ